MKTHTLYLKPEHVKAMKKLAAESGRSFAELVRSAIADYLKRQKR